MIPNFPYLGNTIDAGFVAKKWPPVLILLPLESEDEYEIAGYVQFSLNL